MSQTLEHEPLRLHYTIGVKRQFFPGFDKYEVFGHKTETFPNGARLVLSCSDGTLETVPNIAFRQIRVYPDYMEAIANQKKLREQKPVPPLVEPEIVLSEEDYTDGIPAGQ